MISREWNSIPHSPWKIRTGLCIGIQVLKRWDFTAREISYPHLHLHPLSLPIFQVLFLPQAFLSTEVYPGSSLVTQLLHLSFSWHSTPQLKFSWDSILPWYPNLTPCSFSCFLSWCHLGENWSLAFCSFVSVPSISVMPHTVSQLQLFPPHRWLPNLDLQNFVLSPQLLAKFPTTKETFPWGSAAITFLTK